MNGYKCISNGYANRSNGLSNTFNEFFLDIQTDNEQIMNSLTVQTDNR